MKKLSIIIYFIILILSYVSGVFVYSSCYGDILNRHNPILSISLYLIFLSISIAIFLIREPKIKMVLSVVDSILVLLASILFQGMLYFGFGKSDLSIVDLNIFTISIFALFILSNTMFKLIQLESKKICVNFFIVLLMCSFILIKVFILHCPLIVW